MGYQIPNLYTIIVHHAWTLSTIQHAVRPYVCVIINMLSSCDLHVAVCAQDGFIHLTKDPAFLIAIGEWRNMVWGVWRGGTCLWLPEATALLDDS